MKKLLGLVVFVFLVTPLLFAQEKTGMITDRPDQTESASVVPLKSLQVESGFVYERFNSNIKSITYNSTLFRYGLFEKVELRLGLEYLGSRVDLHGRDANENGFGPISAGAKFFLKKEEEGSPQLALLTSISIPKTGADEFENENLGADFKILGAYALSESISFGANLGVGWSGVKGEDYAVGTYTAVVGLSLSEKLGAFAELYGFIPGKGKNDHRWDGGITYAVNDDLQLDFSTGIGLSKVSPDFFIGLGLSFRIP